MAQHKMFLKLTPAKRSVGKSPRFDAGIEIVAYDLGVRSPRDVATGQASGKRQHSPFKVTKEIDANSVRLMSAITNKEQLSEVVIEVVQAEPPYPKRLVRKIILGDVLITGSRPHIGPAPIQGRMLTDFTLTYETIREEEISRSPLLSPVSP